MKAPWFWQTGGIVPLMLSPFAAVTGVLTARRVSRPGWRAPAVVICVGNATVGGTGKTPLVTDIAVRLSAWGGNVHVLTRGHGGRARGVVRVDTLAHTSLDVGDEPLLLARVAPVWVGADREASARAAIAAGADLLVMDDGLQNPGLVKDFSVLVVDGETGFGNGRLLPAGPLREKPWKAAERCAAAVFMGEPVSGAGAMLPPSLPRLFARLVPDGDMNALHGQRVFAFAGIGRPQKFLASLAEAGANVVASKGFADHHRYGRREIEAVKKKAERLSAVPVTTWKDYVRLPREWRDGIQAVGVRLEWRDQAAWEELLRRTTAF
jgi:tetraacyldisaccharide 4'-kinase